MAIEKFIKGVIDRRNHPSKVCEKKRLDASINQIREYQIPVDPYLSSKVGEIEIFKSNHE